MWHLQNTLTLALNLCVAASCLQIFSDLDYSLWDPEEYEMTEQELDKVTSVTEKLTPEGGDLPYMKKIVNMYFVVYYDVPRLAMRANKVVEFLQPLAEKIKKLGARKTYEELRSYHTLVLRAIQDHVFCRELTEKDLDDPSFGAEPLLSELESKFADPLSARSFLGRGACNSTTSARCLAELGVVGDPGVRTGNTCDDYGPLYAEARMSLQLGLSGLNLDGVRADKLAEGHRRVRHHLTDQLARHAHRLARQASRKAKTHGEFARLWLQDLAVAPPASYLGRDARALLPHFEEASREAGDVRYFGALWLPPVLGVYVEVLHRSYLGHMLEALPFSVPQPELQDLSEQFSLDPQTLDAVLRLAYSRLYYEDDDEAKRTKFLDTLRHHPDLFGLHENATFQKLVWFDAFHAMLVSSLPSLLRFDVGAEGGGEPAGKLRFFLDKFPFNFYRRYRSFDVKTFPGEFAYSPADMAELSLDWVVAALKSFVGNEDGGVGPRESETAAQLLEMIDEDLGDSHLQVVAAQKVGSVLESMVVLEKAIYDNPVGESAHAKVNDSLSTFLRFLYLDGPFFMQDLPNVKTYAAESRRAYLVDCLEDLLVAHVLPKGVRVSILNLLPLFKKDSEKADSQVGCDL